MNPPCAPPGCTPGEMWQSSTTQAMDPEQGNHRREKRVQTVTAIWMLNLTGDLAKELEDLLIFFFFQEALNKI